MDVDPILFKLIRRELNSTETHVNKRMKRQARKQNYKLNGILSLGGVMVVFPTNKHR